ncbi:tRNA 2-selenouridine synthase [Palleronia marisminoris]|uniref:tRNA 2-selenouridine synthase n=1 Tax=Palleronia marisminoris TaxID=315423 RepID=A0A1Y5T6W6_9RHOB|nr:tRNA 2-selenouridine(34) synthase MnmH [Palleronia marisminoris]SFH21245.1 tRNA 2-selenouridine synthase [Palleronia marisminoris]SLN57286.1 tRNA 2-selenouridine synthase [Palleronia marisminoris]
MPFAPHDLSAIPAAGFDTIIDVRSPSEFAEDHVPGSINLPVLDDEERARVGTIYVQQSAFLARKLGAAIVARNAARHIEGPLSHHDGGWRPLVYCWRGGQRSGSFGSILAQIGWRVEVLDGGYQTYRRLVKETLYDRPFPCRVVLLDGFTGTAKTELLQVAARHGAQVIDLEGLANHRGSLFGAMGAQPAQKGFESALAEVVRGLDPARPVLVEAESSKVGERVVPPSLWKAMQAAPRVTVESPRDVRAGYLVRAYADIVSDPDRLDDILGKLVRLQGHERVDLWRQLAREGRIEALANDLMEHHYDPRYAKQAGRHETLDVGVLRAERLDAAEIERLGAELAGRLSQM